MKWIARVILAALAWAVVIGLGVYVHPGWYGLAPLAIAATWTGWRGHEWTPEEYAQLDARVAARREASPAYREQQIETTLYDWAQAGDVEAMKAYLDHQDAKARRPQHDSQWTATDYMLGNG